MQLILVVSAGGRPEQPPEDLARVVDHASLPPAMVNNAGDNFPDSGEADVSNRRRT